LTDTHLFDPGLQPERTALAWRRTVLALAVGAIVALRLLNPVLGLWSTVIGLTGLVLAATLWVLSTRRARQTTRVLLRGTGLLPGAGLLLLLTLIVTTAAVLGLLYTQLS
jgi:uncharacterized membrane protein YidH (DUF202 family)